MQKKQLTIVIVSLLVVVLSVSLAYFTTQILGKGKDVSVTSTNLQIVFTDTDGEIAGSDIEPGWSATKTFTIENKSKEEYAYNIVIKDLVNTFVTKGYLQYKITSTNNGYNMTEYKDIPKSSTATDTALAYYVSIPVGVTQTYTIEFRYLNDEDVDQGDDMGKVLKGTLFITEGSVEPFLGYETGTLGSKILEDNPTRSETAGFNPRFATATTGTLFTSTESISKMTGTPQEVYYYAGYTRNNWVKFGSDKGCMYNNHSIIYVDNIDNFDRKARNEEECLSTNVCAFGEGNDDAEYKVGYTDEDCTERGGTLSGKATYGTFPAYWRIMRTNHDGSIRLLYVGTGHDIMEFSIGISSFNSSDNSPKYVGYKYGEDDSTLDGIRENTTDSTIKTYVDTWYQNNLTNYTKYLSTSAVYCNDRSITNGAYSTSSAFDYAPYTRDYTTFTAAYDCNDIRDAFSVDNKSAKLDYPIGLMTADEIIYIGIYDTEVSRTPTKPWFNSNSRLGVYCSAYGFWGMSPYSWHGNAKAAFLPSTGNIYNAAVSVTGNVRPVVSLKSCVKYASGDGTAENPYTIEETESGC